MNSPLGLIAGGGEMPVELIRGARATGKDVVCLAVRDFADPGIANSATTLEWVKVGELDRMISVLKAHGATEVAFAGSIAHKTIFNPADFDARAIRVVMSLKDRRADALLGALANEFETEGICVIEGSVYLKHVMPAAGLLTPNRPLTSAEEADMNFALPLAKGVAGLDVGQTIVVKNGVVIAIEALEGTDACIRRAGELGGTGCIVVKVSKPRQDMRFDIPTAGTKTVESLIAAKCSAMCIAANESLLLDREKVIALAEGNAIALVAR